MRFFIDETFAEGLATYCENYQKGLVFSKEKFESLYRFSKALLNPVTRKIDEYFAQINPTTDKRLSIEEIETIYKNLIENFHIASYDIGHHMVYSILYYDHKTSLEDIFKLKLFQFFRKYEGCMLANGKKPLISISSKEGYFDYNHTLAEWQVMIKKTTR
jgi:hypothetical protein